MTTRLGKSYRIKDGKLIKVHRLAAGQRKKIEEIAKRESEAWKKKGKAK